ITHNGRGEDAAGGIQRVHRGVDAELGDLPAEHGGGIQVGEGGRRGRVGKVIRGHIHRLHRGDRTTLGGGDALLHGAHFRGQGGLVAHGARHAAQQCAHFGAGLREAEDVVHEEENVAAAAFLVPVAEVFRQGEAAERYAGTRSGRLVHLAEHEGGLGGGQGGVVHLVQVPTALFHALKEFLAVFHDAA